MESAKGVKQLQVVQAMNKNNHKKGLFVYNLVLYSLTGLACSVFISYPFWFSSLSASMKQVLFIYLPCIWSSFSNPKCLFVVANVIIVFLVGESNLFVGSNSSSSPGDQYYDEYVERSCSLRGVSNSNDTLQERKDEMNLMVESDHDVHDEVDDKEMIKDEVDDKEMIKGQVKEVEVEKDDDEEPGLLPAEELNKRVEDFIARVNKQRWLEARSLLRFQA